MARTSRKKQDVTTIVHYTSQQKTYRVGAYVRLSAVDRKQKGDSIETQQAIIIAFVDDSHDLELVEIYIDDGVSGQIFERPAFTRMIADMESGKIDCCITKDLSRLGRNAIDAGYYIEKFFPSKNIRFIAITDDYDSIDPNSSGVMLSMKNILNEINATEIGIKISQTKQMNIRKGLFVGRMAPYGYLKSKENHHILVPDSYAAPIVLKMFEMAADGIAVSDIVEWLNGSSVLPPKRYYFSKGMVSEKEAKGHIHWNKSGIYTILKNRVYCGDMIQGKGKTKSYVITANPKSDWIVVMDTHEAIVSRELFDKVQQRWADRKTTQRERKPSPVYLGIGNPNKRLQTSDNIFLRKVFCGHCGYTMRRFRSSKVKHRFKCETRSLYHSDDCVLVSIGEDSLKEVLLNELNKQAVVMGDVQAMGLQLNQDKKPNKTEILKLQSEIDRNNRFLQSLYEKLSQGDITSDEYKALKASYESKIALLKEREKELRDDMLTHAANAAEESTTLSKLNDVQQIADLTAETLDRLVKRINVYEDKRVEIHFAFTDKTIQAETKEVTTV